MIQNMRDLGGLRAADGRTIRPNMLIRSAQLSQAGEECSCTVRKQATENKR